jgi:hypothetical protein
VAAQTFRQAAIGVSDAVTVTLIVSPFVTDFDADRAPDCRKFPAVDASQIDTWLIVSDPADHEVHETADAADDPADGAANVSCFRVVSAEAFDVPADPGSPVCSFRKTFAGAVMFVAR